MIIFEEKKILVNFLGKGPPFGQKKSKNFFFAVYGQNTIQSIDLVEVRICFFRGTFDEYFGDLCKKQCF